MDFPDSPCLFLAVPMGRGTGTALAHWRARRGVPLDVTCLPGVELLSSRERELCAAARLLPAHYLALKDVMLRDAEKNGAISRTEVRPRVAGCGACIAV